MKTSPSNSHKELPNIISITVTYSQQYAIVVTGEDKCIRVFHVSADGRLEQMSTRSMPKRPCAITVTRNDQRILAADKFGDVYSLPLLLDPAEEEAFLLRQQQKVEEAKLYEPTATELTVHSGANRKALESQLLQAKQKLVTKTKEPLQFSHKLELGHVSILTDVLITGIGVGTGRPRTYILTSDRDEHIRVSRAPPQAHVIEGYCLGHREFVSKLCRAEPRVLVSGGGDDELFVWDWIEQKLINRINIKEAIKRTFLHIDAGSDHSTRGDIKVAVSGLHKLASSYRQPPHLLVLCEGVPAVFHLPISSVKTQKGGEDVAFIPLAGNPLDIAFAGPNIVVSIDTIHTPGSTTKIDSAEKTEARLQAFQLVGEDLDGGAVWKPHEHLNHLLTDINQQTTVDWHEKALQSLLYNVETLRKRRGEDDASVAD